MRLFVGVEVSPEVAAAATRLIEQLRRRAATLAPHSRITWVTSERLHVTVRFIGQVDDEMASAVAAALRPPFPTALFTLTAGGVGAFPPRGPLRAVWVGLTAGRDELIAVEDAVSGRLEQLGIGREVRPYSPHLTLARVRDAAGLRSAALLADVRGAELGSTSVGAITLFESRLSPKGPTYVRVQRTALG